MLDNANFTSANLQKAKLVNTWVWKANLSGANLRGADLRGTCFCEATLLGVDLTNVVVQKTGLSRMMHYSFVAGGPKKVYATCFPQGTILK